MQKIYWYSNKDLFPILKNINFINRVCNLKEANIKSLIKLNPLIINLYQNGENNKNHLFINNLFNKNKNIKQNTQNLYEKLSKYYKIKKYKIFSNKKEIIKKDIDIFFNWKAPIKWKSKEFSKNKWRKLEGIIKKRFKNIVWQNPKDSLLQYLKKIKRSKKVVSIVGLGNHLSILYNIPTIILCGPTFFSEAKKHRNIKLIFPRNPCNYKYCKKLNNLGHCGNTKHINVDDILKSL